jgi:pyruvate/2-oxoglutarate/acetoin dehydrogenase E1 component
VLGHDQDTVGGGLDATQAPNVRFNRLRVHNVSLTTTQIASIANGQSMEGPFYNSCATFLFFYFFLFICFIRLHSSLCRFI